MTGTVKISWKEEGRGLTSIKDCLDATIQGIQEFIKKIEIWLITEYSKKKNMAKE